MKNKPWIRTIALMLTLTMTGCGTKLDDITPVPSIDDNAEVEASSTILEDSFEEHQSSETEAATISTVVSTVLNTETEATTTTVDAVALQKAEEERKKAEEEEQRKKAEEERKRAEEEKKLAEQRNSFTMMYYLAITAEEIRTSKDNRLALEDIYTSLLNDINPGSVDEITQDHLKNLRDIIKAYLETSTKRERLQFIYNQEKASAIRNAVPNPLAILSVSNATDKKKLALAVAYAALDSYNSYKRSINSADMAFIMSGWELDDKEKETVMKNRDRAFDYMVDMVQNYDLDDLKTLNEKSIEQFAEICATENAAERIKLLKAEESTYSLLGNYWLELANAYFETSQYSKCLECVEEYEKLSTGIFRKDFNYLHILPKAIVAAQETYSGSQYNTRVKELVDAIEANTTKDDWATRYFAAQVCLDLYSRTNNIEYLKTAYNITSENVAVLLKDQRTLNTTYLDDVVEQTAEEPDYRYMNEKEKEKAEAEYKAEKKRVKEYNKSIKSKRETELPSLYEPLVINCELLFSLAEKINLDASEKAEINAILKTNSNGVFLVKPINDIYSFNQTGNKYTIELSKDEIIIPADLLTDNSQIAIIVSENGSSQTFDDCVVSEVERKGSNISDFKAYVSSKKFKKYDWTADSKVEIKITYSDVYDKTVSFKYYVSTFEDHWYGDKVVFSPQ